MCGEHVIGRLHWVHLIREDLPESPSVFLIRRQSRSIVESPWPLALLHSSNCPSHPSTATAIHPAITRMLTLCAACDALVQERLALAVWTDQLTSSDTAQLHAAIDAHLIPDLNQMVLADVL